jgi:hypothetical protein
MGAKFSNGRITESKESDKGQKINRKGGHSGPHFFWSKVAYNIIVV